MLQESRSNIIKIGVGILAIILIAVGAYLVMGQEKDNNLTLNQDNTNINPLSTEEYTATTTPNDTPTNTPPNSPKPNNNNNNNNSDSNREPTNINLKYTSAVNWPPTVNIQSNVSNLNCVETRPESSLPERIRKAQISGQDFCVREKSDGAAGSVYTEYTYSTIIRNNQLVTAKFTLKYPQCSNYSAPEKTACEKERTNFNPDSLIAQLISNLK